VEDTIMNWKEIEGRWNQITGQVKSKWGKLTDDDLAVVAGKRDQLIGKVQERYGIMKDDAEKQVDEWLQKFDTSKQGQQSGQHKQGSGRNV
jgi:uncharacterized protein YjbJ (UPF0337 family)